MAGAKTRKQLATRASNLRRMRKQGATLTQKQEAELAEWDAMKNPNAGRPPKSNRPMAKKAPKEGDAPKPISSFDQTRSEIATPKEATKEPVKEPDAKTSAVQETLTPEPPPEVLSKKGKVTGDWRAKYGSEQLSREQLCTLGGKVWVKGLKKLNAQIIEMEQKPFLDDEFLDSEIYNACVLTVDHVLPDDLEMTPQVTAAAGTTVVLAQRATIGFVSKKKKAKEDKPQTTPTKEAATNDDVKKKEERVIEKERHRVVDTSYKPDGKDVF